jgi:Type II CAAX prenyl endopeptidase Rce1-like
VLPLASYFVTGLLFGWVSWHAGSIWFSWGMHFANNVVLAVILGSEGDVYDPASGLTFVFSGPSAWTFALTGPAPTLLTGVLVWWSVLRRRPSMGRIARARRAEPSRSSRPPNPPGRRRVSTYGGYAVRPRRRRADAPGHRCVLTAG